LTAGRLEIAAKLKGSDFTSQGKEKGTLAEL